jgi:hypothetical protein
MHGRIDSALGPLAMVKDVKWETSRPWAISELLVSPAKSSDCHDINLHTSKTQTRKHHISR